MRRLLILAAALSLTLGGCVNREAQEQGRRTQEILADTTRPVTVVSAAARSLEDRMEITGEVVTGSDVVVGAKIPGRIVSVYVRDGDAVAAGQLIAAMETTNQMLSIQQAEAQVASARSALSQAQANAAVGPERSRSAVSAAEAQLRSARAQLAKARAGARPEERAQAEAQVSAARSNMETAKRELERQQQLHASGAVSLQRVEQAQNAYQSALSQYQSALEAQRMLQSGTRSEDLAAAEEAVRQAEEGVRQAQSQQKLDVLLTQQVEAARAALRSAEAQVRMARQSLEDAQIRAPFSGRVSGRPVQPGAVLPAGGQVARLIGVDGSYFEGEVPAGEIMRIQMGDQVEVRVDGLPNRVFSGSIAATSPSATGVGRLFRVRVQLNGGAGEVKPGMFARGSVTLSEIDGIAVPATAVVTRGGESLVFVVDGDKARRVPVQVGLRQGDWIQVSGLQPGDQVVVTGQNDLEEGSLVRIENPTQSANQEGATSAQRINR
jgi:HlyD family secretion protein